MPCVVKVRHLRKGFTEVSKLSRDSPKLARSKMQKNGVGLEAQIHKGPWAPDWWAEGSTCLCSGFAGENSLELGT